MVSFFSIYHFQCANACDICLHFYTDLVVPLKIFKKIYMYWSGGNAGKKCQRVSLTNLHSNMDIRWCLTKITLARFPLNALKCSVQKNHSTYHKVKKRIGHIQIKLAVLTLWQSTAHGQPTMSIIQKRTILLSTILFWIIFRIGFPHATTILGLIAWSMDPERLFWSAYCNGENNYIQKLCS